MPSFQTFVLVVAIITLILVLILIGYTLQASTASHWPPLVGDCPDYWVDMSNNGKMCANVQNLGSCTSPSSGQKYYTMDFSQGSFLGGEGRCAKYKWAKNCGVEWDGITAGVSNPCAAQEIKTS